MIDAPEALRSHLIAASPLRTLLGGDFVFTPEVPATFTGLIMPAKAIAFRFSGGQSAPYLHAQQAQVNFRCYGSSHAQARDVYQALYDRLHLTQNFIVGGVGFHGASELVPGEPLEDPGTNWPFVFAIYDLWLATVSVA